MRVILTFSRDEAITIPADYRRRFISLLKEALMDEYPDLYKNGVIKPYTFAVVLNMGSKFSKEKVQNVRTVIFKFSTGSGDIFGSVLNFAIRMINKGGGISFGKDAPTFPLREINTKIETPKGKRFKTLSPIVVNNPSGNPKNPKEHFIIPRENGYEERLFETLKERMEGITGKTPYKLEFKADKVKEVFVKHYGGFVRGFVGSFEVEADPETLRFIYDYGLGIRTGQGFGMVDYEL